MSKIEDGTGRGFVAAVTRSNQLFTLSEVVPSLAIASLREDAYILNHELTISAGAVPILLLTNLSTKLLGISRFSVSNTVSGVWSLWRNPQVSLTGTDLVPSQLNFTSSKGFTGEVKTGVNGDTMSGVKLASAFCNQGFSELNLHGAMVLGPTDSIGISFETESATDVTVTLVFAYLGQL